MPREDYHEHGQQQHQHIDESQGSQASSLGELMTERQSMMSFWHRPIEHSEAYDVCTLFIHIRGELDHLFRDQSTRIATAWSRVANRMAEEGYPLPCANPGKRCNQKWRNLEKVYRKHSSYLAGRLPGTTGTAPIPTPQYFEEISSILGHSHAAHPVIQVDSLAPATVTTPAPSTVTSFHPLSSSTVASAPVVPPVPTPQPLRFVRLPSSLLQTLSQSQVLPSGPPPPPPAAFSPPPPPHSLESTFNMSPERPISSPSPPHFSHYIPISSLIRSHSPPPSPIHSHSSSLHSQIITRPAPTITQPPQTITRPPQTITRPLQTITRPPQAPRFVRLPSSLFQTLSRSQVLPSGPAVSPPPAFSPPPPPHSPESTFDMSPERPTSPPLSSQIITRPPQTITRPLQTITRPPQTITRPPQTITQPLQTITQPLQTITQPRQTVTRPLQTITQPRQTVTRPRQTVTRPPQTPYRQTTAARRVTARRTTKEQKLDRILRRIEEHERQRRADTRNLVERMEEETREDRRLQAMRDEETRRYRRETMEAQEQFNNRLLNLMSGLVENQQRRRSRSRSRSPLM
ncbi:hypothetical protein M8J76_003318 [Diaphorina citri]|nr:hypothetical protein M8J76_003318 [Diaphorina citri]